MQKADEDTGGFSPLIQARLVVNNESSSGKPATASVNGGIRRRSGRLVVKYR
jgi:hypothetical protein